MHIIDVADCVHAHMWVWEVRGERIRVFLHTLRIPFLQVRLCIRVFFFSCPQSETKEILPERVHFMHKEHFRHDGTKTSKNYNSRETQTWISQFALEKSSLDTFQDICTYFYLQNVQVSQAIFYTNMGQTIRKHTLWKKPINLYRESAKTTTTGGTVQFVTS